MSRMNQSLYQAYLTTIPHALLFQLIARSQRKNFLQATVECIILPVTHFWSQRVPDFWCHGLHSFDSPLRNILGQSRSQRTAFPFVVETIIDSIFLVLSTEFTDSESDFVDAASSGLLVAYADSTFARKGGAFLNSGLTFLHHPLMEQFMIEGLFKADPLGFLYLEALLDEIFGDRADRRVKRDLFGVDSVDELDLVGSWPRCPSMQHFIVNETDGPQIRFVGVLNLFEQLGRHIERCSNDGLHDGVVVLAILGKAEVADFALTVPHENVRGFEVAVNDAVVVQILDSLHDLPQINLRLLLVHLSLPRQKMVKVAVLAQLCHDVHVVHGLIHVEQTHNVGVRHFLHDFDFRLNVLHIVAVGKKPLIDHFDRNLLSGFDHFPSVDCSVGALSQQTLHTELILFNSLLTLHRMNYLTITLYSAMNKYMREVNS